MIAKDCLYCVVRVYDLECETPPIESVLVVRKFLKVFLDYLKVVPPEREIDLLPNMNLISIPPYGMPPTESKELKLHLKDLLDNGFIQSIISPRGT